MRDRDFDTLRAELVRDYVAGSPISDICVKHDVSRRTVTRAVNAAGVPLRKGSGAYGAKPEDPKEERDYDQLRPIPETPCGCGTRCGLTFRKVKGQRGRKWAKGCPDMAKRLAAQKAASSVKREALRAAWRKEQEANGAILKTRGQHGRRTPGPPHVATHWCEQCGGLPHRRPRVGPCACGEFFEQDAYQTLSGRIVMVAP